MFRDYELVSPSLEGILSHESLSYEGFSRPLELLRALDGPATKSSSRRTKNNTGTDIIKNEQDRKVLEDYFHDLHGIFMKKLSYFIVQSEITPEDRVTLQAMLQEMLRIKNLI